MDTITTKENGLELQDHKLKMVVVVVVVVLLIDHSIQIIVEEDLQEWELLDKDLKVVMDHGVKAIIMLVLVVELVVWDKFINGVEEDQELVDQELTYLSQELVITGEVAAAAGPILVLERE